MAKKLYSLMDLQYILSDTLAKLVDKDKTEAERAADMATAAAVNGVARNMVHIASTALRAKELIADGKIKDAETVDRLVGKL